GTFLKRAVSNETTPLTRVNGKGILYVADSGKHITLIELRNEAVYVNGNDLLAFEPSIAFEVKMIRRVVGMMAGGLFCVKLTGAGVVAISSHGEPTTLQTSPAQPLSTDPNATIAWSGNLTPELKMDTSFKTLMGRGGGETFQMIFRGDGFVVIQPFEEMPTMTGQARP
ncbi:MAG TPA: AIM24 family protein, partial [Abditibacterium sp.]